MKKMMTILLLLCMVMAAAPVSAEEYSGIGWEVSGQVDRDHFSYLLQSLWMNMGEDGSDEMLAAADALLAFANEFSFRGEAGEKALQARLCLKDQIIVQAGMGQGEDGGILFDTSLLPGYVLAVPAEKLQQMEAQLSSVIQQKTPAEIAAAGNRFLLGMNSLCAENRADFEALQVSAKEEATQKTVQGVPYKFSHITVYQMTGEDIFLGMQKLMNGTLTLLEEYLIGIGVPEDQVSVRLSEEVLSEDNAFGQVQIRATCFRQLLALSSQQPCTYWNIEMEAAGETYYAELLNTPGFSAPESFYLRLYRMMDGEEVTLLSLNTETGRTEEETYFTATLDWTGTVFTLDVRQYERINGGIDTQVRFYLNDPDAPLGQIVFSWWPLAKAPDGPKTEDAQVTDVLEPLDDALKNQLQTALQSGAGSALVQVIMAMPEEAETLMNLMVQLQE